MHQNKNLARKICCFNMLSQQVYQSQHYARLQHLTVWFVSNNSAQKMAEYKGAASEGNRAMHMQKRRERAKEQIAEMKAKIVNVSDCI